MCSEKQRDMYAQFEPDANEIVFGQRTAPDRPLTDHELSKRNRIVLKLVDQKLKFELIELMKKRHEQILALQDNSTTPISSFSGSDHDWDDASQWGIPSNYFQPTEYGNAWQPSTTSFTESDGSCQIPKQNQNQAGASAFHFERQQSNTYRSQSNLIELPVRQDNTTEIESTSIDHLTTTTSKKKKNKKTSKCSNIPPKEPTKIHLKASLLASGSRALTSRTLSPSDYNQRALDETSLPSDNLWVQKNPFAVLPTVENQPAFEGTLVANTSKLFGTPEGLPSHNAAKRKQEQSSNDIPKKMLVMNEATHETSGNPFDAGIVATGQYSAETGGGVVNTSKTETTIDLTSDDVTGENCSGKTAIRSKSTEWSAMEQLVANLFLYKANNWTPLSANECKLKHEILVQMSINPDDIGSHSGAQIVRQRVGDRMFDEMIHQSKIVLTNLRRTDPENQASFFESRKELVEKLSTWRSSGVAANETQKGRGKHSKIANLVSPFLCSGKNHQDFINALIKNPYSLQSNEAVKNQIVAKGQSVSSIMKSIKIVLDESCPVRLPKKFTLPLGRFIDVPFIVKLFNRSAKMTEESASELTKVLVDSIECMKMQKPSLRDIRFKDGALEILCINTMSFVWLKNTLSSHLGVDIRPVRNPIPYDQLKTVCLTFHVPQYLHFNNLMEHLRVNNPCLLTRRWELRAPRSKNVVDSTKCLYVGVDVDSLIGLEQMNRVGTLHDSLVHFEISYGDSEENFVKMNFVNKKKTTGMKT